ncbi:MAG: hypothetical protein K2X69_17420 [Silvanigrellaceae bacterium]|nr:hypothetical protein [Silvanigrellaceae bacterium]
MWILYSNTPDFIMQVKRWFIWWFFYFKYYLKIVFGKPPFFSRSKSVPQETERDVIENLKNKEKNKKELSNAQKLIKKHPTLF